MKDLIKIIILIALIPVIQSCGLLGDSDGFNCEKNAPLKQGGKDVCATAIMEDYQQNIDLPSESMEIRFVHGTGGFNITISVTEIETNNEYAYPGDVSLWFAQLNKSGSGTVTITDIDRTNRTISGQYDLTAEGAANFQAYDYHVAGTFTDVNF